MWEPPFVYPVTIKITKDMKNKLERACTERCTSRSEFIRVHLDKILSEIYPKEHMKEGG
ncbi:MAG: ribbon-helix-helix protein, CopG family [Candidatus Lokiarchaeota archaeon]|nr:ribbon-helix-helix protein, CopG family [Candidatus Lokiarchaeota archaeon]